MSKHNAIECCLQLLVSGHEGEDDLLIADRELGRVSVKDSSQVCKPVVELGDIAVILELRDVSGVNLNASMTFRNCRTV